MPGKRSLAFITIGLAIVIMLAFVAPKILDAARSLPDQVSEQFTTPKPAVTGLETPRPADAFVDSIGVNVHLHFLDTNYNQRYDAFRSLLVASGIRHLRDGLIDTTWQPYYQRLDELARSGVHADLITDVKQSPALLQSYGTRLQPGTIDVIEGPNEYNTTGGEEWSSRLAAFQRMLYSTVRGNARYANVRVVGPSLTLPSAYADTGDLSTALDYGNTHPYPAAHEPETRGWGIKYGGSYGSLAWNLEIAHPVSGSKALFATETGYGDAPALPDGVSPGVKSRYVLRLFLEAWNSGVVRTYLYQFLDAGSDGYQTYGIVDNAMRPKPAYTAIKNLISQLSDAGPAFRLSPLAYTLRGPSSLHHALFERRDGSYALVLWLAIPSWDTGSHQPIVTSPTPVTIDFAKDPRRVAVATFQDTGMTIVRNVSPRRTMDVPVADNVVIVNVSK